METGAFRPGAPSAGGCRVVILNSTGPAWPSVKAAKNALAIAGLVKDRAALEAKKATANTVLAAADAVLRFAQTGSDLGGDVLTGALAGIFQLAETARDGLDAAEQNLQQLEA